MLETDLHCKGTGKHQYLHTKLCHRYIYKKYIPFGQAIRLGRIISNSILLDDRLKELETWFTTRKRIDQKWRE